MWCAAFRPAKRSGRPDDAAGASQREGTIPTRSRASRKSQRDLNPCLHLERLSRAGSMTCSGGRKGPFTCGYGSGSVPVVTPRFSMSCGIDTGSEGGGALQPPFSSGLGRRTRITRPRCSRRDACLGRPNLISLIRRPEAAGSWAQNRCSACSGTSAASASASNSARTLRAALHGGLGRRRPRGRRTSRGRRSLKPPTDLVQLTEVFVGQRAQLA